MLVAQSAAALHADALVGVGAAARRRPPRHRHGRRAYAVCLGPSAGNSSYLLDLPRHRPGPRRASGRGCSPGGSSGRRSASSRAEITGLAEHREAMLYGIAEGVVALDPHERITLVNDVARRLLDLPGARGRDAPRRPARSRPRLRDVLRRRHGPTNDAGDGATTRPGRRATRSSSAGAGCSS